MKSPMPVLSLPSHVASGAVMYGRVNLLLMWLVQPGDNPAWADRGYDHRSWPAIDIRTYSLERHDRIS